MHSKRYLAGLAAALMALTGCMAPTLRPADQREECAADSQLASLIADVSFRDSDPVVVRRDEEPETVRRPDSDSSELSKPAARPADVTPDNRARVRDRQALNAHSVGWVNLPGAGIDEVILHYPGNNDYYLHRDFYGNSTQSGSFFADYRARFGEGTRDDLRPITALYGHSYRDDPDSGLFSGLKYYRDEEFARNNPYIYFSTWKENMAFEVVAVFESHVHIPYNRYDLPNGQYQAMLETVSASSLYNYNTTVDRKDKLLVLSTCAMNVQGHQNLDPYTTNYRFVVMGKLVPAGRATKTQADFTVNPSPAGPDAYRAWWESLLL